MSWLGAIRTATGGLLRHKMQAVVIGMVLLVSTASATLGFALLAASNASARPLVARPRKPRFPLKLSAVDVEAVVRF